MEPFVAIDFETANEKRGSACAVGLVRFDSEGREEASLTTLIKPHDDLAYFNPRNTRVHGIRETDVADALTWPDIYPRVAEVVEGLPLVAHNMAFDGYVLTDLDSLYGYHPLANRRMCTLRLARTLLAGVLERKSLDLVYRHYFDGESFAHHDAGADALAAGRVFSRMQDEHGFDHLAALCPPPRTARGKRQASALNKADLATLMSTYGHSRALVKQRVTFTGSLARTTRATMAEFITELGAIEQNSVTLGTTLLVVGTGNLDRRRAGASASRKLERARTLQERGSRIRILSEDEFFEYLS